MVADWQPQLVVALLRERHMPRRRAHSAANARCAAGWPTTGIRVDALWATSGGIGVAAAEEGRPVSTAHAIGRSSSNSRSSSSTICRPPWLNSVAAFALTMSRRSGVNRARNCVAVWCYRVQAWA